MRLLKNQKGFTLIEMLIVMLIITVLIAIAIPNVTKQSSAVEEKGCKAFVHIITNISTFIEKPCYDWLSETTINQLLISSYIIEYFRQKNKEETRIQRKLVALFESSSNCHYTETRIFRFFFDISILHHRIGIFKGDERSFSRVLRLKLLFFVCLDEQPLSVIKKQVRLLRANAINSDISFNKLFPISVNDERRVLPLNARLGGIG
ncbi:competence type IV pilus major pilin ComGC [Planococcus halocryophilus]|uniref:competence type IV pilus major pilin ComGC n=1 Tax=Planococcus halocryophilus TaxID=1215089 RepID=UPI001F0D3BD6|nr:prepilin-type N-terminal cleavage/methylation domain-containing protein [Planococcus halocryophilus]MCH4825753.1 prepilin-type N-terminal cleavage/methylation domain-containing protein [Planococcus halocryophilus]